MCFKSGNPVNARLEASARHLQLCDVLQLLRISALMTIWATDTALEKTYHTFEGELAWQHFAVANRLPHRPYPRLDGDSVHHQKANDGWPCRAR
jgi:hypothetical protein